MQFDKITKLGRYFLGIPMAVFGIQHFLYAQSVMLLVPSWIPAALFWTYLAGIALLGAGVAIIIGIWSKQAATLVGLMIFIWVLILHIPRALELPGDKEFINVFDALFILSGAFILSASTAGDGPLNRISVIGSKAAPFLIAGSLTVFGIKHFEHGQLVFIVGADYYPLPGEMFWVYLTGAVFIASAVGIAINKRKPFIAALLGVFIFFITLIFYGPQLLSTGFAGHTLATFLKGMAMCGSCFVLAQAGSKNQVLLTSENIPG